MKQVKDLTNMEELLKSIATIRMMISKLESDQNSVDLIQYSMAL
jgi:hypothetical protein